MTHEDVTTRESPRKLESRWRYVRDLTEGLAIIGIVALFGLLIWNVLQVDTTSAASVNDRLLQLTQWTISTVLTVAIALVGYNWISTRRNAEQEQRVLDKRFAVEKQQLEDQIAKWQNTIEEMEESAAADTTRINAALDQVSLRMESLSEDSASFRDEILQLRKRQAHQRMTTMMLDLIQGSPTSRTRHSFPGTLDMFLELRHLDMTDAISSPFTVALERLADLHPDEPVVNLLSMENQSEELAKWLWMLDEAQSWINENTPDLRPQLERFARSWVDIDVFAIINRDHSTAHLSIKKD